MPENIVAEFGYLGLFAVSFGAATVLPFASEPVVVLMVTGRYSLWAVWALATAGNCSGALLNYYIGRGGTNWWVSRYCRTEPRALTAARERFSRWGAPVLFFSWVPIIGDPLTVIGGVLQIPLRVFAAWVFAGKALRYALIIWLAHAAMS